MNYFARLPRYDVNQVWTPWNCICLTDTETRIHVACSDLKTIYGEKIIKDCLSKHSLAKSGFKHLKKIDKNFMEMSDWADPEMNV